MDINKLYSSYFDYIISLFDDTGDWFNDELGEWEDESIPNKKRRIKLYIVNNNYIEIKYLENNFEIFTFTPPNMRMVQTMFSIWKIIK